MNQRSPYYSLLHPKPLARRVSSFGFPRDLGDRFQILHRWLRFASDGKPSNLIAEAQFLHDIFVDILGYRSPFETSVGAWELELHPKPVLGFFAENLVHIIVEISINTAEQGAIVKPEPEHETTEWLVVLDYREICLYHRDVSSLFCQRFAWESLADLEQLKAFYFLLSRRTLLKGIASSDERSRTTQLLEESHQLESEILRSFYSHYAKIRGQLIKDFRYRLQSLAQLSPHEINALHSGDGQTSAGEIDANQAINIAIYQAQKLLNRILFVAYCEDRQLLPEHLIKDAYEFINPYMEQPIWENYKAIFRWIRQGNADYKMPIEAYPLSIFESDRLLDQALFVGDELCRQIKEITRFDFDQDITRHMLTGLLDESLKELAQYRKDLSYLSKRRSPKLPCKNIIQSESVIKILQNYLSQISPMPPSQETADQADRDRATLAYCCEYQQRLLNIKVVHPKCGSGVFLVTALEFLISEHERIHYLITKLAPEAQLSAFVSPADSAIYILQHNLFGCDLSADAVDMTRLVLCLRSLEVSRTMPKVNHNIQLGDLAGCDFGEDFKIGSDRGEVVILK